ncbi:DUF4864 domain-containing protein [Micavibrio aeruginosavorus]|uniref:DUF4864 domain-containing protein n=1 Tax=Micavibrio aeruginosavorus TaxID=349221 RepID=UPI003F4AC446
MWHPKTPIHIFRCFLIATATVVSLFLAMDSDAASRPLIGPPHATTTHLHRTALIAPPRYSPDRTPDDATIQTTIETALNAIRTRNVVQCSTNLTRDFRDQLGGQNSTHPTRLLGHIRMEYWPVYNHRAVALMDRDVLSGGIVLQQVRMVGRDNKPFTAIIRLKAQVDGAWLIDGITILDRKGPAA